MDEDYKKWESNLIDDIERGFFNSRVVLMEKTYKSSPKRYKRNLNRKVADHRCRDLGLNFNVVKHNVMPTMISMLNNIYSRERKN